MSELTLYNLCSPRPDVLEGKAGSDFAADLASVVRKTATPEYLDPARFFANTYPTRGLRELLANVCRRLSGSGNETAAIFRLDTSYGGGKTHGLIALAHVAAGLQGVPDADAFVAPELRPKSPVRIAAFDGENADPANGRQMGDGVFAKTPWGEIAYALAGLQGYDRVRTSDEKMVAPGAQTIGELFGDGPVLILLDELSVYLRKVYQYPQARAQLTAFLTALFKAVETAPQATLVYTLAVGRDGIAADAYSSENQFIFDAMAEIESVSARKATLLNPTEEDETVMVLVRRLFERVDSVRAAEVVDAYRHLWTQHAGALPKDATLPETTESFRNSYPFHPDLLDTLTGKISTLSNFQRVRGMLRLLARTVANLWNRPIPGTMAIHLHHIDLADEPTRSEVVTRLAQGVYLPAITNDIASLDGTRPSLAQDLDARHYRQMPPYTQYVARCTFLHTLAFNEPLKGVTFDRLRFDILAPGHEINFIEDARSRFVEESCYLDDRPGVPMRFLADANLKQIIRRQEQHIDPTEVRTQLKDRIRDLFKTGHFELNLFPNSPQEVPDDIGDGRPRLVVISPEAESIASDVDAVPSLVARLFTSKGSDGTGLRLLRNNLVFLVVDDHRAAEMRQKMVRRLALWELKQSDRLAQLADHQRPQVQEQFQRAEHELAVNIQQAFRHVFYPSRNRLPRQEHDLAHSAIEFSSSSDQPGNGQNQVVRALRDLGKLRLPEDDPDSPQYIRDRTPLKRGTISTRALRDEYRRDPGLSILVKDDVFVKGVRLGIERGEFVYRRNDLVCGQGDPPVSIAVDEQAFLFTRDEAARAGIWPRLVPTEPPKPILPPDPFIIDGPGVSYKTKTGSHPVVAPPAASDTVTAESNLREAFVELWEKARRQNVTVVRHLDLEVQEPNETLVLWSVLQQTPGAAVQIDIQEAGYETAAGGELHLRFSGPVGDVGPIREFLKAQFQGAKDTALECRVRVDFDADLAPASPELDKFTEKLTKYYKGTARLILYKGDRP